MDENQKKAWNSLWPTAAQAAEEQMVSRQSNEQVVNQASKNTQKNIEKQTAAMNNLLTGDKAVDAVITTPESQWTPYQIAVANLNGDLRGLNKKYQAALQKKQVLENEQANVQTAGEIMMKAYRDAMDKTEAAAAQQMNANSANANIQAGSAISGM